MKKIVSLIIVFALLSGALSCRVDASEQAVFAAPGAYAAVLMKQDDRRLIYSKNADIPLPMASTTKIMTALIALENLPADRTVTVRPEAVGIEGSSMYLESGEKVTVRDLLYALMLQSANDAAAALALECAGSIEAFADLMNDRAAKLALTSTHFVNPHGLDDPDHYTTARELALITAAAMENEEFRTIVSTRRYAYTTDRKSGVFVNHNKLLFSLENCTGVKTGYTKRSGRVLVSSTESDGLRLIAVTINSHNDWNEHKDMHTVGRNLFSKDRGIDAGEFECRVPVVNGESKTVLCSNPDEISFWKYSGEDAVYEIELPRFIFAPVDENDVIGRIVLFCGGVEKASCPVVAKESVASVKYPGFFGRISEFIKELFNKG